MGCACSTITWERVSYAKTVTFERVCATVVDLVAFSAADGHFFTSEGYTIIVKR